MKKAFGDLYSLYYDIIYSDKDYSTECDYLVTLFKRHSQFPTRSILELGAGTGAYSLILAERGYSITAVDMSRKMLEIARLKSKKRGLDDFVSFKAADMRLVQLPQKYDACVSMFAVVNYLGSLDDLKTACRNVARHLRPGGLFVFDFWNGGAVTKTGPSPRHKIVKFDGNVLIRLSDSTLDLAHRSATVRFRTFVIKKNRLFHEFMENHKMRYFFRDEIEEALGAGGLQLLSLHPFLKPDSEASDDDWNVTAVARRT